MDVPDEDIIHVNKIDERFYIIKERQRNMSQTILYYPSINIKDRYWLEMQ